MVNRGVCVVRGTSHSGLMVMLVLPWLVLANRTLRSVKVLDAVDPFVLLLRRGGGDSVDHVIALHHSSVSFRFTRLNELPSVVGDVELEAVLLKDNGKSKPSAKSSMDLKASGASHDFSPKCRNEYYKECVLQF